MEYNMIFVLGYDLLQKELAEQDMPCDIAFDVCKKVYEDFLTSEEYKLDTSEYDALYAYINNNKESIDSLIVENGGW